MASSWSPASGSRPPTRPAGSAGARSVSPQRGAPAADRPRRFRAERWYGSFVRSFRLPDGLAGVDVDASYADGVLTLSLPKPAEATPKRIEISRSAQKEIAA